MFYALLSAAILVTGRQADPEKLVAWLGDEDFAVRESSHKALGRLGFDAEAALWAGFTSDDAEIRRHCGLLLDDLRTARHANAVYLVDRSFNDYPMLDSLWWDTSGHTYGSPERVPFGRTAYDRLNHLIEEAPEDMFDRRPYSRYRQATRAWSIDLVEAGVPVGAVKILHLIMWHRDRDFLVCAKSPWVQPDWWPVPRPDVPAPMKRVPPD